MSVFEDANMTAMLPDRRPARIHITLTDGRQLDAEVTTNKGDWQDPYSSAELKKKYISLTSRLWAQQYAENVYEKLMVLERINVDDI